MIKIACIFDIEDILLKNDDILWKKISDEIYIFFKSDNFKMIKCKKNQETVYFFYEKEVNEEYARFLADCINVIITEDYNNLFCDNETFKKVIDIIKNYSIKNIDCCNECNIFTINIPQINETINVLNIDLDEL